MGICKCGKMFTIETLFPIFIDGQRWLKSQELNTVTHLNDIEYITDVATLSLTLGVQINMRLS